MIDILFNIFIYPIVFVMELILNASVEAIGYLLAIVIISAMVSIILIPIKKWAGKIQELENTLQYKMYPALTEIKQKYRGEKQFYKMKALYKKYNYHPIKSMRAMAGLVIQIPFFIGAYYLLSSYSPINPFAFGLNLTTPDGLLFGLNLFPFIMAGITILIAHNQGVKNKFEKYGIAIIFLVLLYFTPSALLIYWTMNLIFSWAIELISNNS